MTPSPERPTVCLHPSKWSILKKIASDPVPPIACTPIRATMSVVVYTHMPSTSAEISRYSTAGYSRDSDRDAALVSGNLRVSAASTGIVIDRRGDE
jgi:hypothetical protein